MYKKRSAFMKKEKYFRRREIFFTIRKEIHASISTLEQSSGELVKQ